MQSVKLDPALYNQPYKSVDEVLSGLTALEAAFRAQADRRGVFVTAYVLITGEIKRRIASNLFLDPPWVARYVVAFANLYRLALQAYEAGNPAPPKAWQFSFDTSKQGTGLVLQDLILGINAHINHDLSLALNDVSIDPDRQSRYQDHTSINLALQQATAPVIAQIEQFYAPGLGLFDPLLRPLELEITNFSFENARENAWVQAVGLANAKSQDERAALEKAIDERSAVLARLILAPTADDALLLAALRDLERFRPWWNYVTSSATTAASPTEALAPVAPAPTGLVQTQAGSLEGVIARLGDVVARFDAQRSRLAIYPLIYRETTLKVREGLAQREFHDPAWVTRLEISFANRYFRTLEAHEAGLPLPACWAAAFQGIAGGKTTIVQDIMLQVNARVNYDLPLALYEAGLEANLKARHADYERPYTYFLQGFDSEKELLARTYTGMLRVEILNPILGRLDATLAGTLYERARKEAWDNALRLSREPLADERLAYIRRLDCKAAALARRILLYNLAPTQWVTQSLRYLEDRFPGTWSDHLQPVGTN